MQPEHQPPDDGDSGETGNVVDPDVFAQRRARQTGGDEGLTARVTAAERSVAALERQLAETRDELVATAAQRDRLASALSSMEIELRVQAGSGVEEREHALRTAESELQAREAGLRAREAEVEAIRAALDDRRAGLEARVRDVHRSLADLSARLAHEQTARTDAESAFAAARAERERQVEMLRAELDERGERLASVQHQLAELRSELYGVIGREPEPRTPGGPARPATPADLATPAAAPVPQRLEELREDLNALGKRALRLERERDEARAERMRLERETAGLAEQLAQAQAVIEELGTALSQAGDTAQAAAEALAAERSAREQLEQELARERDSFREQLAIADGQLRAEMELQRQAFDAHAVAVSAAIEKLRGQLDAARSEMEERTAAERSARLRAEAELAGVRQQLEPRTPVLDPELRPVDARSEATGSLDVDIDAAARRLREAAPEQPPEAGPQDAGQPEAAVAKPIPFIGPRPPAARPRPWLAEALAKLAASDPGAAGRAVVELLPGLATALPDGTVADFAVDEAGAHRLTIENGTGSVKPWRAGSTRPDIALAGSALALAPVVAGGCERKLRGVERTGRRLVWRRIRKARRDPQTLADLQRAGARPDLGVLLTLLATAAAPTTVERLAVRFVMAGDDAHSWVVRTSDGVLEVVAGTEPAEAVVTVPVDGALRLFGGIARSPASGGTVEGDVDQALALLNVLDGVQREA